MATFQTNDRNGQAINFDTNTVGANVAGTTVLADPSSGAKANIAPNGVALSVSGDTSAATYWYTALALAPVATPTDIVQIQGSATRTCRIKRIKMSGVATAAGNMPAQLFRRSAAASGGGTVLTAVTAGKADTNDPAATCVVSTIGTANPAPVGAVVGGALRTGRVQMAAAATGVAANDLIWDFSTRFDKACVLRGVADFICINMNGAAIPAGGVLDIEVEIEEMA